MTRRCGISSPPLAALALLLLLCFCFCYSAAAARLLPANTAPHQGTGVARVEAAGAATTDGLVALKEEGGNGGEAVSPSEVMAEGATAEEAEEEEACEEGKEGEACMQRRLLHDAHLDYIYTQHKGRP